MFSRRRAIWGAAGLALLTGAAAVAETPKAGPALTYTQQEGDQATYGFSATATMKVALNDGTLEKGVSSTRMTVVARFLGLTADGTMRAEGEVVSGTTTEKLGQQSRTIRIPQQLANYELTPQGLTKTVDEAEVPTEEAGALSPSFGPDDAFLAGGVAVLPKRPLKAGDRWQGVVTDTTEGTGEETETRYESKALGQTRYAGRTCWKIRTTYRGFESSTEQAADGSGQARMKMRLVGTVTWLFDPQRGVLVSSEETAHAAFTILLNTTKEGENAIQASLDLVMQSKLVEFNDEKLAGAVETRRQKARE